MPPETRAELIGGIVYIASSLRIRHGKGDRHIAGVLFGYEAATPGVDGMDNATTILGPGSEPQPDHGLRLLPEFGGQSRENDDEYLVGAPELIIEVAHSTEAVDLHQKKADYRAAHVREYLVFCIEERQLRAFDLPANKPWPLPADGIFRSKFFPGLWLDAPAIFTRDARGIQKTARAGLRSAEHVSFVKQMKAKAKVLKRPKQ